MEGKFFINGREVDAENALVSVFDLGFMYGATFMEALRSFNHKPFRMADHLDRMERSIKAAGLGIPVTRGEMEDLIIQAFDGYLSEIEDDNDCWVCINITPGRTFPHPLVPIEDKEPTVIVYAVPLPYAEYADFYTSGINTFISTIRNSPPQVLSPRIKVRSRMHYFMAKTEVKKIDHRAFPLLLDLDGNLSEGSGANIFLVIDGELHTPARDNILEGVSRKVVLELAEEMELGVNEGHIQLLDIRNADEAFFTTSTYCILPIKQIDREEPLAIPGPITSKLLTRWSNTVGTDIVAQAEKYRNKTAH